MSPRILGDILAPIARIFDLEGGRLNLGNFNSEDGIVPVYDVGQLVAGRSLFLTARTFDTDDINQSTAFEETIEDLPTVFRIVGMNITATDATRISSFDIWLNDSGVQDDLIVSWRNGEPDRGVITNFRAGALASRTYLQPPAVNQGWRNRLFINGGTSYQRAGYSNMIVRTVTTAFGAGTVRLTGNIFLLFGANVIQGGGVIQMPIELG